MQYLLMIYRSEAEYGKTDDATRQKVTAEYGAFTQSIIQSGNFKAGDRLQPTTTATTVRVRNGKRLREGDRIDFPADVSAIAEARQQKGGVVHQPEMEPQSRGPGLRERRRRFGRQRGSVHVEVQAVWRGCCRECVESLDRGCSAGAASLRVWR